MSDLKVIPKERRRKEYGEVDEGDDAFA